MLLKVLNILYNCHDNCLHLICVWEYMNYTFYPNCIIMIIMKYKYGAIYLGRPENREGGWFGNFGQTRTGGGGGLSKTGRPENPKVRKTNTEIIR